MKNALAPTFSAYSTNIEFGFYCERLEILFNKKEEELKQFAFQIFDVNGDKRLSESDLFELMKICTFNKPGAAQSD